LTDGIVLPHPNKPNYLPLTMTRDNSEQKIETFVLTKNGDIL